MAKSDSGVIEFRLLGPIEAVRNEDPLPLGGSRQRALLALLLLQAGRPVAADRLVDELWHGEPPGGASTTVRSYVSKLRSVLGPEALITRSASGYALDVVAERVDSSRFEQLVKEGQQALVKGASRRAGERLGTALELWRGTPFAGLGEDGALRREADRLEELRLLALEARIEADLALGTDAELVEELEALLTEHPYRERLWHHLMLALYRAERQADALAAYGRARTLLDEQLGLEPSEELKRLEQAILRHEVPPARPPEEQHNLPAPVTSFVGREAELADVERLLGEARLVTLTGVGGAGKTRLALEAAARAVPDSPDGVFFVDFSALAEPALVPGQVAAAVEVREQSDAPVTEQLATRLREAELLLVLDNCEHLRQACAELAQTLLAGSPLLHVLATSRELLGVPGEVDYPVPPLTLPSHDAEPAELRSSEAVRLFLSRARDARPRLADDADALASAARICRDLDGLPLAIELAAARAKAFSLEEIATRLSDRFRFLVSWRRLSPARHQTLREAIDWSFDLLSDDERALLARLSVFAGGFTMAAAADVCLEDDDARAVELVGRLVDASLVVAEEHSGATRYRLLETVRQYGAERLGGRAETAPWQRRHADHFLALAEAGWSGVAVGDMAKWTERLARENDNLRAALAWSRDAAALEHEARLAKGLWWFWWVRGDFSEGRGWLHDALERGAALEPGLRAELLEGAADLAWAQGDLARASELARAALPLFTALGDLRGEHACFTVLGHVASAREDLSGAESLFQRTYRVAQQLADELRSPNLAVALHNLGSVAFEQGDLERATERYQAALSIYQSVGDPYGVALSELYLGLVAVEAGRHDDAAPLLGRALPVFREMGFLQYTAHCLEGTASVVRAREDSAAAVRLLAAAQAIRERTGNHPAAGFARRLEREIEATRAELGESRFATAWAEGSALAEDDALDRAAQHAVAG